MLLGSAVDQGSSPVCISAAWTNALLAVNPAQRFPDGRDAHEWALHAHEATIPDRTGRHGSRRGVLLGDVGRVFRDAGLIAGYRGLPTLDDVLDALDDGPVVASLDWTDGMELPDPRTHIARPTGRRTPSRHAVALLERITRKHSTTEPNGDWVRFRNSRGPDYGDHGDALIAVDDLRRLFRDAYRFAPARRLAGHE